MQLFDSEKQMYAHKHKFVSMGRGQVVRHRVLVPTFVGSNPTGPVFNSFSARPTFTRS